jgi:hypothetical protein
VCFVAAKAKSEEKKQVLGTSNKELKITQRKILLPLRRPEELSKQSKTDIKYIQTSFFLDISISVISTSQSYTSLKDILT